jgi:isopenicillin-N epimerase
MKYLKQSREALARFVHCEADDLVYVTNPSYAVNILAKSMDLKPGDEVLTTNLEYGACDRTWNYYCEKKGAKYVRQKINFPIPSKEEFVRQFFEGLTAKTRLVFMSHITSSTGLRLPVEEICTEAKQRGLLVCIDGAHAPGQIPLDLGALDPDFYTGACHKWMMTPKGSSFLYVKKSLQSMCDPLVVSWGYKSTKPSQSQFLDYHQTQGTRDFSAFLTIPDSIRFMEDHNWTEVAASCRALVKANAPRFRRLLGADPLYRQEDDFAVQMCSTILKTKDPDRLHDLLMEKYKIEIPVMQHEERVFLRYSIQAFNAQRDLDLLYQALEDILKTSDLISVV